MRLKEFTLNERIKTFSDQQKDKMKIISDKIKQICDVFDIIIEFENYCVKNILLELDKLIELRNKRSEIELNKGNNFYIKQFKEAADELNEKIINIKNKWNVLNASDNPEKSIENINKQINILKGVSNKLKKLDDNNLISIKILIDIIDEFRNFKVYKAMNSDNLIDTINILIELKEEIEA